MELIEFVLSQLPPPPGRIRFSGRLSAQEELLARYRVRTDGPVDGAVLEVWEADVEIALGRVAELLRPGGVFVLELPFAERLDDATRDWLYAQQRVLELAGVSSRVDLDAALEEWAARQLPLERVRALLEQWFDERVAEFVPVLYKTLAGPATYALEEMLAAAGAIQAVGFRYAGTSTETTRSSAASR